MKFCSVNAALLLLATASVIDGFSVSSPNQRWGVSSQMKPRSLVVMNEKEKFSLGTLFGNSANKKKKEKEEEAKPTTNPVAAALRGTMEPHPSVRDHISPLNRLGKDKAGLPTKTDPLPVHPQVRSGVLDNGLPYVILPNKSPPGRFEAHLQVFSGSGKFRESALGRTRFGSRLTKSNN